MSDIVRNDERRIIQEKNVTAIVRENDPELVHRWDIDVERLMPDQPERYTKVPHPNLPGTETVYMCNTCGCWVLDRQLHNTWHRK